MQLVTESVNILQNIFIFQKYLSQFHYISPTRAGNHDPKIAIENFQRFFQLPVTGRLDSRTLQEMHKPRCGVPEKLEGGKRIRLAV